MKFQGISLALFCAAAWGLSPEFWSHYGDGKAEVSTYKTVQPRYGEPRDGRTVLIYVPEHVSRATRIKVENYQTVPKADQVQVMKLNRVLRFNTGIYDYAVMTTVASAMTAEFYPLKISLSANEWCGNYYEHLLPDGKGARRVVHSYFQAEGDRNERLEAMGGQYEDNLWVLVREFEGEFLKPGETRKLTLLPSLWRTRQTHRPPAFAASEISKTVDGDFHKWAWTADGRTVECWTEKTYPHYIVRWNASDGESGERIKTVHLPYWERQANTDLHWRAELGLP